MYFSIVIPVFNRPEEISELLKSLTFQTYREFEVIIVEDGSDKTCKEVVDAYKGLLNLRYLFIENVGQGFARNRGMELAGGEYLVLFDSDCIIPPQYLDVLYHAIRDRRIDAHGGPDAAEGGFSVFQKAINYGMTSMLTTGGIRGGMKDVSKFQARGFNMGMSKIAYQETKGFIDPNQGEDIELSIRLRKEGFRLELVKEAYVYHKRRNTWRSFCRQSYSFGQNRVNINRYHPGAIKPVHMMPAFFALGLAYVLLGWASKLSGIGFFDNLLIIVTGVYGLWILAVMVDSTIQNRSLLVGALSVITASSQLTCYGLGLITAYVNQWAKK